WCLSRLRPKSQEAILARAKRARSIAEGKGMECPQQNATNSYRRAGCLARSAANEMKTKEKGRGSPGLFSFLRSGSLLVVGSRLVFRRLLFLLLLFLGGALGFALGRRRGGRFRRRRRGSDGLRSRSRGSRRSRRCGSGRRRQEGRRA